MLYRKISTDIETHLHYPQYLTMLKFLREEGKFTYIASGSLLGIALRNTASIPVGSIIRKQMYQLDFEEWLMAEGWGKEALDYVRDCYKRQVPVSEVQHQNLLHNIVRVREVQESIRNLYKEDAAKYEKESSNYDNAKKGEVDYLVNNVAGMTVVPIEVKSGKDFTSHKALDRFLADKEYNIPSGIVLDNEREVYTKDNVTYMPIYYIMCIERAEIPDDECIF